MLGPATKPEVFLQSCDDMFFLRKPKLGQLRGGGAKT